MNRAQTTQSQSRIHPDATVGQLELTVADLSRSISFYKDLIGLQVIEDSENQATFGVPGDPFLTLSEQPEANPWPRGGRSYAGLYHFAILVPERVDLGRWLAHWLRQQMPLPGQGDHFVSEALYLEDPDGHGIEIYWDRPRETWEWQDGQVRMGVEPVDIRGLLELAESAAEPWTGMPNGTTLGHIHLQVSDIDETARFYDSVLGLDIVAQMPSALFMSAGGYHHHIGANVWHSRGGEIAPPESARLVYFTVNLPDSAAMDEVLNRLETAGVEFDSPEDGAEVQDPSGILIRLKVNHHGE
jgi:catechol 2,3-dioxygenase